MTAKAPILRFHLPNSLSTGRYCARLRCWEKCEDVIVAPDS